LAYLVQILDCSSPALAIEGFGITFSILSSMQLGPKAEDVSKPVNPITFLFRFLMGTICAAYYVLVPIYMWIKDQIVPKGMPI
jgi:hypothetical protein